LGSHSTKIVLSLGGLNFGGSSNARKDIEVDANGVGSSVSLSDDEDD